MYFPAPSLFIRVITIRRHVLSLVPAIAADAALFGVLLAGGVVTRNIVIVGGGLLLTALLVGYQYMQWRAFHILVYADRIIVYQITYGIPHRRVHPFARLSHIDVYQNLLKEDTMTATTTTYQLPHGYLLHGRWRITGSIAQTRFSTIYRAYDERSGGTVAVKRLAAGQRLGGLSRAEATQLLEREAHTLRSLQHPRIPRLRAAHIADDDAFLVLDYITGMTLEQLLARVTLSPTAVWTIAEQLCGIAAFLHQQNVPLIYADYKPGNIIVTTTGDVFLTDFGLARRRGEQVLDGQPIGTPDYAPPEQLVGRTVDERSDVFALGQVLKEVFGDTVSPELRLVLARATAPRIKHRHATAVQLRQALRQVVPTQPARAAMPFIDTTRYLVAIAIAAIALLLLSLLGMLG